MTTPPFPAPTSILIIGSGVFGLSTLHALLHRPSFASTTITLLETHPFPAPHTASIDNTRIIRADYADAHYASLAASAQRSWRDDKEAWDGAYHESGLLLTAESAVVGGGEYVRKAKGNVSGMVEREGDVKEVRGAEEVAAAMRVEGVRGSGDVGYLNVRSGWADAEAGMRALRRRTEEVAERRGGVEFVVGEAVRLLWDAREGVVRGAALSDGREVQAAMTILATGAWTGRFVDLRGVASARGQCIAYVDVTREEEEVLKEMPVHLNMSNGMFFFPPNEGVLKVARHAYGYTNPTTIPAPLFAPEYNTSPQTSSPQITSPQTTLPQTSSSTQTTPPQTSSPPKTTPTTTPSLPTFPPTLPSPDTSLLSTFLTTALPLLPARPFRRTRICWYLDTRSGEYLVCRHPLARSSLFLATAGSGHAYKFLPVLGERVVDVLEGEGGVWAEKWRWPAATTGGEGGGFEEGDGDGEVWCEDGSRAGERGCLLQAAFGHGKGVNGSV